jgi:hypothetical protein
MNAPLTLAQLAAAWQAAKADEKAANARRLEIEEQIVESFPLGIEGTETIEQDGFKVKVTHKLTRAVDSKALQARWNSLSAFAQDVFTWKADVSKPLLVKLQENHPELYVTVAPFITSKPAKPSVEVTLKEAA